MKTFFSTYSSVIGTLYMSSDGKYLTGLSFHDLYQSGYLYNDELDIFKQTKKWLDLYFQHQIPDFTPPYRLYEATPFRQQVLDIVKQIPYGQTITYNDIAKQIAKSRHITKMSAQAVGGAVGWNPIVIIIPCHRVIGSHFNLTGYGGGIENKIKLLQIEGHDLSKYSIPKTKTWK